MFGLGLHTGEGGKDVIRREITLFFALEDQVLGDVEELVLATAATSLLSPATRRCDRRPRRLVDATDDPHHQVFVELYVMGRRP